jgi:GT2 family glycosyltransferase
MGTKKNISVVIPSFNGKELLEQYLPSLLETLRNSRQVPQYETIVVDDASTDGTDVFLTENYPEVIYLKNTENMGFSKTSNRGLHQAKHELVLFLNNDMVLNDDFFEKTIPYFDQEDTFGVFSEIRDSLGEKKLEGQKAPKCKKHRIHYEDNRETKGPFTFYLCGGNALVSRKKMLELQGFNEIFSPFYFEDFDVSLRAWRKGWKCYYTEETFCKHCHSQTINSNFSKEYVQGIFLRNRFIFNDLHKSSNECLRLRAQAFLKIILYTIIPTKSHRVVKQAAIAYVKMLKQVRENKKALYSGLLPLQSVIQRFE